MTFIDFLEIRSDFNIADIQPIHIKDTRRSKQVRSKSGVYRLGMPVASSRLLVASFEMLLASSEMLLASSRMLLASSRMLLASSRLLVASSKMLVASSICYWHHLKC
jgi:hypothetical protein